MNTTSGTLLTRRRILMLLGAMAPLGIGGGIAFAHDSRGPDRGDRDDMGHHHSRGHHHGYHDDSDHRSHPHGRFDEHRGPHRRGPNWRRPDEGKKS